jgi:hypothetical protein
VKFFFFTDDDELHWTDMPESFTRAVVPEHATNEQTTANPSKSSAFTFRFRLGRAGR